ncbi:hypothetical protein KKG08_01435 [Patescibacteria group bacterium]|nr:hypothetical protein [Patescibacteria group bacterium]
MAVLLKDLYFKVENLKGKKLIYTIAVIFLVFILVGVLIGYFMTPRLSEDEVVGNDIESPSSPKTYYEGKIEYINPEFYPLDDISYSLVDSDGKQIYLLKSVDQKLSIAEGLFVKVSGKMSKLKDKKTDVLIVDEVVIKNATD